MVRAMDSSEVAVRRGAFDDGVSFWRHLMESLMN